MRCVHCNAENPPESLSCDQCGMALASHPIGDSTTRRCGRCAKHNPPDAQFCGDCGMQFEPELTETSSAPSSTPSPDSPWEYVGFWVRLVATIIDVIIVGVAQLILARVLTVLGFGDTPVAEVAWLLLGYLYSVLLVGHRGQTIGKMAVGIQVVDTYGNVPGLRRAVLREVVGKFFSGIVLFLGYVWVAWEERKRGWHDYIGTTYVIRKPS
jgi:uncharacterized RDD family membrane protein YckC/ribosomal protein L40E